MMMMMMMIYMCSCCSEKAEYSWRRASAFEAHGDLMGAKFQNLIDSIVIAFQKWSLNLISILYLNGRYFRARGCRVSIATCNRRRTSCICTITLMHCSAPHPIPQSFAVPMKTTFTGWRTWSFDKQRRWWSADTSVCTAVLQDVLRSICVSLLS